MDGLHDTLTTLHLSSNNLTAINDNINHLTNLTELRAINNDIDRLPRMQGVSSSLKKLVLRQNRLTGDNMDGLNDLTNLEYLYLSANPMTKLPVLSGVGINADFVILYLNNIHTLPYIVNCTFCHFYLIVMMKCELTQYPDFSSCEKGSPHSKIQGLYLTNNNLNENSDGNNLINLSGKPLYLYLSQNQYKAFPKFPLTVYEAIDTLQLDYNYITEFDYKALEFTWYLQLRGNAIGDIDAFELNKALCRNDNFKLLDMSFNGRISVNSFPDISTSLCYNSNGAEKTIDMTGVSFIYI